MYLQPLEIRPLECWNIYRFLTVPMSLIIIVGSVEIYLATNNENTSHLSFAVWNLDSIPATEYARIPFIETLQATYSFDLFGVCESSLSPAVPNEDRVKPPHIADTPYSDTPYCGHPILRTPYIADTPYCGHPILRTPHIADTPYCGHPI